MIHLVTPVVPDIRIQLFTLRSGFHTDVWIAAHYYSIVVLISSRDRRWFKGYSIILGNITCLLLVGFKPKT